MSLLLISALLGTSCDEAIDENFPSEYETVMHFKVMKGETVVEVPLLRIGDDSKYNVIVGKGGYKPSADAEAVMNVMTEDQLAEYCKENSCDYKLLPSKYYKLSSDKISFVGGESSKAVEVTFKTENIATDLSREIQYVLPLCLSASKGAVYKELSVEILKIKVKTPMISSDMPDLQSFIKNYYDGNKTFEVTSALLMDLNENKNSFIVNLESDENILAGYVEEYKKNNAAFKNARMLPIANYTIPASISFAPNDLVKELIVNINYDGLDIGNYLLPVVLKNCEGRPYDVNNTPRFIHIDLKKQLSAIILTPDMLSNSTRPELVNQGRHEVGSMLDGDPSTYWQSEWSIYTTPGDSRKPHDPKYGLYLDIELANPICDFAFDYQTSTLNAFTMSKRIKVYFCNSKEELDNNLMPAVEINSGLPNTSSTWYRSENYHSDRPFRYVRISSTLNYQDRNLCDKTNSSIAFGELKIYGQ